MYQHPGIFSRAPYPNFIAMDKGLLAEATNPALLGKNEFSVSVMDSLRSKALTVFHCDDRQSKLIERLNRKYTHTILFPLQVDGHFTVDGCLDEGVTQFEIIVKILEEIPKDIALIVTSYRSRDIQTKVLTADNIPFLESRYPNFIFDQSINSIPNASQSLAPLVDGVIVISSSVGYQAALWRKPLFCFGRSHLKSFQTDRNFNEFLQTVTLKTVVDRDDILLKVMSSLNFPVSNIGTPSYIRRLRNFDEQINSDGMPMFELDTVVDNDFREGEYLAQIGLFEQQSRGISRAYSSDLAKQIARRNVISFDIFDTLVNRPFMHPADLFDFIEEKVRAISNKSLDFRYERKLAEREAFEAAVLVGRREISLFEIYEEFRRNTGVSESEASKIMDLEISSELQLISRRESGHRAYMLALSLEKRIILVSDMYLPRAVIAEILQRNGYFDYERLFLSNEADAKKHTGALFDYVLLQLELPASQILHIGDNVVGDVNQAKSRGIKAFHLVHSIERFKKTSAYTIPWQRDESRHALDWTIVLALIAHKLSNNPYQLEQKGTLFNGDPWRLGYYGMGPLLLAFAKWLVESSINDGVERLYFLSRDGKAMKEAYDIIAPHYPNAPKSVYLYCSRRSVNLCKSRNIQHLLDLIDVDFSDRMPLRNFLKFRFGLNIESLVYPPILAKFGFTEDSRISKADKQKLKDLISCLSVEILAIAEAERLTYLKYLKEVGMFEGGKVAVVDIGYAGTMQESLFILGGNRKPIDGYYLITFRSALKRVVAKGLRAQAYLANFVDRHDTYHPFCKNVPLYETIFSSPETSFVRMEENWRGDIKPVFVDAADGDKKRAQLVVKVHAGANEFVIDFMIRFEKMVSDVDFDPNKVMRVLDLFFTKPHPLDAQILEGVEFEDLYGGHNKVFIHPVSVGNQARSAWLAGREALHNDQGVEGSQLKLPNVVKRSRWQAFSGKMVRIFIGERKFNKLVRNPSLFFYDSKVPLARYVAKFF